MARTVKSAPITLEKSLAEPIPDEELVSKKDTIKDEEKAILERNLSATMGEPLPEHPVVDIFPSMTDDEYAMLKLDIAANGQLVPINTYKGQIIDGRHRYRASRELGIEPITTEWNGEGSLTNFVVGMNLNRRHLNTSQRAAIAYRMLDFYGEEAAKRELAGTASTDEERGAARDMAGRTMNVSGRLVSTVKKVGELAPDLVDEVIAGKMTVNKALTVASERPNADGTPRVPVARQGSKPPAEERTQGAIFELYDVLNNWQSEYGRVPSLKPLVLQVREWIKICKAEEASGADADVDNNNFNANDYPEGDDEDSELLVVGEEGEEEE
jgi:ParB-like chromosome segregation protein Spo0J